MEVKVANLLACHEVSGSLHSGVLLPDGKFRGATKIAIGQHNRVAFSDNNAICARAFSALFPLNFVIISEPALVIITRA